MEILLGVGDRLRGDLLLDLEREGDLFERERDLFERERDLFEREGDLDFRTGASLAGLTLVFRFSTDDREEELRDLERLDLLLRLPLDDLDDDRELSEKKNMNIQIEPHGSKTTHSRLDPLRLLLDEE